MIATILRLLSYAESILEYVLPLMGKYLEQNRRGKQALAVVKTVREAERLLKLYQQAKADGRLTPQEIEWIIGQMEKLVASLKEVVEWKS